MDDHFFCVCNVWFECFPVRSMLKGNICCQTHSQPDSQTSFERLFFNNCMWFSAAYKIQAPAIIHRITRMPVIFRNNIHFFTFLLHDFMVSFQLKRKYWHRGNKCRLRHPLFFPLCHIYADHPAGSSYFLGENGHSEIRRPTRVRTVPAIAWKVITSWRRGIDIKIVTTGIP